MKKQITVSTKKKTFNFAGDTYRFDQIDDVLSMVNDCLLDYAPGQELLENAKKELIELRSYIKLVLKYDNSKGRF